MSNTPHTAPFARQALQAPAATMIDPSHMMGFPSPRTLYAMPVRRVPRAGHVPLGRALHLIDLENLMGGPFAGNRAMAEAVEQYRNAAWVHEGDHVWVSVNPALMLDAESSWHGCRLLVGGGRDGADKALIREVRDAVRLASLYDRIMIGSGDGIFEIVAAAFTALGIPVGVVSRPRSLAHLLARAATFVRYITVEEPIGGVA